MTEDMGPAEATYLIVLTHSEATFLAAAIQNLPLQGTSQELVPVLSKIAAIHKKITGALGPSVEETVPEEEIIPEEE